MKLGRHNAVDPAQMDDQELKSRFRSCELIVKRLNPDQRRLVEARMRELLAEIQRREEQRDADT